MVSRYYFLNINQVVCVSELGTWVAKILNTQLFYLILYILNDKNIIRNKIIK